MGERDAAQADELIRALCGVRHEMIRQLRCLQDSHLAAAELRRDIDEAQAHVTRLQRRYLGAHASAPQRAQQVRRPRALSHKSVRRGERVWRADNCSDVG